MAAAMALAMQEAGQAWPGDRSERARTNALDVSHTALGRQHASDAAARFRARGVESSAHDLKVLSLKDGGILVLPRHIEPVTIVGDSNTMGGSFVVSPRLDTGPPKQVSGSPYSLLQPYWQLNNAHCFSRISAGWGGWMDTCWKIFQLANDGSSSWNYWTFEVKATAKSEDYVLDYAWITTDESRNGGRQYWVDWDPGSDSSGNCSASYTVSVSIGVATVSDSYLRCETWDITKYADPAHFKSKYGGNAVDAERQVGHMTMTKVGEHDSPVWEIGYEVRSCHFVWMCDAEGGP